MRGGSISTHAHLTTMTSSPFALNSCSIPASRPKGSGDLLRYITAREAYNLRGACECAELVLDRAGADGADPGGRTGGIPVLAEGRADLRQHRRHRRHIRRGSRA